MTPRNALFVSAILLAPAALAQEVMSFPGSILTHDPVGEVIEFQPQKTDLEALTTLDAVTLTGFPMPDGTVIDLALVRIPVDPARYGMFVDGQAQEFDPLDMTLWSGHIEGNVSSNVSLCLSSHGTYGWVFDGGQYTHLSSFPGDVGGWSNATGRIYSDRALQNVAGPRAEFNCEADQLTGYAIDRSGNRRGEVAIPGGPDSPANSHPLDLRMAIETDFQYYKIWSNLQAAQTYTVALLGAASNRYESQIGVVLTFPYIQYHTNQNDGWNSQDGGGGCGDVLNEFVNAWAGNIPMGARLAHFLSGANLGCGVAYLDVICNKNSGFAVSGNINGGVTFPVNPGSNTWDFVVFTHETGHNCGALHTHDYCPPIDKCYNNCTGSTNCPQGTNMSYCHLCGGMSNISTYFHPQIVNVIRATAESSCIPDYDTRQELVLFQDDFESGDFTTGGWNVSNTVKVRTAAAHLSNFGARVRRAGWIEKAIDTTGYDTIKLYYARRTKNFDSGERLRPRWHDGTSWKTLEEVTTIHWGVMAYNLPAGADNNPNLRIRFKANGNMGKERGDVDDVLVTGRQ
jgi:metallopeptidase family M12-like protein